MTEPNDKAREDAAAPEPEVDDGAADAAMAVDATEAVDSEPASAEEADADDAPDEADAEGPAALAADEETRVVPTPLVVPSDGRRGRVEGRAAAAAPAAPVPERAIRIDDRISKVFVLVTLLAFALILANGLFFGVGGVFRPYVSPSPPPSELPSPSASGSASPSSSASPSGSGSASPSVSASPSGSAGASGSAAPSSSVSAPSSSASAAPSNSASASPSP